MLNDSVKYWHTEHDTLADELLESKRHHQAWMTLAMILGGFSIGMTVLFVWAVRL